MHIETLRIWVWPVSAFVASFVGLAALGFNVLKSLQLESLRKPLQYLAGAAGAFALCTYGMNQADPVLTTINATGGTLNLLVWMVSAITALCVGLAAFGCDVAKSCGLSSSRKALQYVVGASGIYSLMLYYQ
jgi:hypothetical protein